MRGDQLARGLFATKQKQEAMDRPRHPIPPRLLANPVHLLSFGFGTGLAPKGPGTVGTLVGIPFFLLLSPLATPVYLLACLVLFLIGIGLCEASARRLGVHDHSGIVWDEIVGFLLAMTAVPATWYWILLGFILFRVFDIWKPWPIRNVDRRLGGGFGIMLDDVLAALYAWGVLQAAIWLQTWNGMAGG